MNGGYVLLVEDNPDDVELTRRAFKMHHIVNELVVARDGVEALDMLSEAASTGRLPALVLLDLNLPKVSGFEVLRHLRSDPRTKLQPVVVLTSSGADEDIIASYRDGANAYVRKPVAFAEFADAVSTLGIFWLLMNKVPPSDTTVGT